MPELPFEHDTYGKESSSKMSTVEYLKSVTGYIRRRFLSAICQSSVIEKPGAGHGTACPRVAYTWVFPPGADKKPVRMGGAAWI